jgi:hypothetical protein
MNDPVDPSLAAASSLPPAAGGAHRNLGVLAQANGRLPMAALGPGRINYRPMTTELDPTLQSEEARRQFLLTGLRKRRHSEIRYRRTDTLGQGKPLPPADYRGPTHFLKLGQTTEAAALEPRAVPAGLFDNNDSVREWRGVREVGPWRAV